MSRQKKPFAPALLSLFGMPLLPSDKLSLSDQIHDILLCQIQAGRWKINERLPSISQLAVEIGLSRQPIQQAFEALRGEGFLRQQRGNGTFLSSQKTRGAKSLGSIGVLMTSHPPESVRSWGYSEADNWRLHAILRQAAERHYLQEVHCIPPGDQENLYSRIGGLFSKQVRGILSLRPFSIPDFDILPSDSLPIVFLGYYAFRDGPCVALDLETGFYRLTREVIRQGHRRILLIPKAYPMPSEMELIYKGFERAMVEAGLSVDREAYEAALRIEWADLRVVREHLAAFADPKGPRQSQHATAVVSAHYNYALSAIAVADLMGIRVPSDLSVVGMISGPIRLEDPNQRLTGIEYDVDLMVRMGFEVLEEQMRTRRNSVSLVRVKPIIQHGDSLAPPRKD